jgi:hypothetical protein
MALQLGHVDVGAVVDRLDVLLVQRDADEHADDGLRHRHRGKEILGLALVLVALGEDVVAAHDEQPGVTVLAQELVDAERGLLRGALQRPRRIRFLHHARRIDDVVVAHHADEARLGRERAPRLLTQRITLRFSERLLVRRGERRERRSDGERCGEGGVRVHSESERTAP